jgi:MSHA biogenesis protein MshL
MYKNKITVTFLSCLIALLGCQSPPTSPDNMKKSLEKDLANIEKMNAPKALGTVPVDVQQELMRESMNHAKQGLLAEKRLEISANNVAAKHFFAALVEGSPYSIAIHPEVEGEITINLKEVTIGETLKVIEELYGYQINRQNKVIQIYPAGMRTETIPLNYLFIKRFGQSNTSINSGGVSENDPSGGGSGGNNSGSGSNNSGGNNQSGQGGQNGQSASSGINIQTANESDFWKELEETLSALVGEENGRRVIVSPQAGLVTIRALPQEIKEVKKFVNDTQTHLHRQVIIEAKIMEVTLDDNYQQGVRWDQVLGHAGNVDLDFSTTGNIAGNALSALVGGTSTLAFQGSDFSGVIELLETQGNVQVLSSPRITVTNNQKAVIKVGSDEYFVTEVSSTTTTGTSTTTTPEIQLTPFFSGIALDVTPQIDPEGVVILHVHPSVTLTDEQNKVIQLGGEEIILPLAQSRVRESDTIIRANSGEIVIIGGLIETRNTEIDSKTPFLGDIPYLGELFKSKSIVKRKTELVIMLKPIVVGQDTWKNQLHDARSLLKEWFPQDDTFGEAQPEEVERDEGTIDISPSEHIVEESSVAEK